MIALPGSRHSASPVCTNQVQISLQMQLPEPMLSSRATVPAPRLSISLKRCKYRSQIKESQPWFIQTLCHLQAPHAIKPKYRRTLAASLPLSIVPATKVLPTPLRRPLCDPTWAKSRRHHSPVRSKFSAKADRMKIWQSRQSLSSSNLSI